MITSGLVSVTFRQFRPKQIVNLVAKAGLDGIEWGGDIHVPHGRIRRAREVYRMTVDAGLRVLAYGSYYRVGAREDVPFEAIVETAAELHTGIIRVWAGQGASADADAGHWQRVVGESRRIACLASARNMSVAYEFHGHSLTDTDETTVRLLREVAHAGVSSYWQMPFDRDVEASLRSVLPWLSNVHVFYLQKDRLMLSQGALIWRRLLRVVQSTGRDHSAMLEFVKGNDPEVFVKDAETLKNLVDACNRRTV